MKDSYCDVLIIGAGPAGVMCANALAREGISVRVVDKRPENIPAGQADGIQPRTIEVLHSYGLADKLLAEGAHLNMMAYYNPTPDGKGIERTSRAPDVNAPTTRYQYKITLNQTAIEDLFLNSMRQNGLHVERPVIPTNLKISDDETVLNDSKAYPVEVTLHRLSGPETCTMNDTSSHTNVVDPTVELAADNELDERVHAKYVLGADGAHSWVRNQLGIKLEGEHTKHIWAVVDCVPETNFPDIRNRTAIHSNNGSCMIIPREGDLVRLYIQLADAEDLANGGRLDKSLVTPDRIMNVAKRSMYPYKIEFPHEPIWWTVYIISQRVATQFSVKERVFIAGDACHTHSPKAGLGMNASMNDTHNLAWKLIHVLRGWAFPKLLETYDLERKKFAQDLINFDRKLADMFSGKAVTADNMDGVSHEEFQALLRTEGGFTAGTGIQYQPSIITQPGSTTSGSGILVVGQRVPPQVILRVADCRPFEIQDLLKSDAKWKLLFFVGDCKLEKQIALVNAVGEHLQSPSSFLKRYTPKEAAADAVFLILWIARTQKEVADYTDVPKGLRSHWSTIYTDDVAVDGKKGGDAYENYGIGHAGGVAAVRPDGYVGYVGSLKEVLDGHLDEYFSGFMFSSL
ncbi:hypothetical protein DACRYDRAFT_115073 [Dacryopinax primogenitus]|uniref:FAD binding domain-containing protein n=1 Tax=Dacryopinax primogenitus (strain DJM 731) TaxID=1858805 RepID=M5G0F5_DACPD|nr:uncharacterized protein DACRYDRAFT_115073 [Dacryopinax primogenitus]EJU03726.1 hypothetical protein DACRYDRAFT_115073 [Dacryopinax primogenitus]